MYDTTNPPAAQSSSAPPARVLIVDDEQVVRESLEQWFRAEGYHTQIAVNGQEALALAARHKFDVALVDLKMPGMDGLELQLRLRDVAPDITLIFMTGYATVETAVQALKHGAYDYVTKPIDPDELTHLVSKAVDHRRIKQQVASLRDSLNSAQSTSKLIGRGAAMRRVFEFIEMVAPTDATVLLTGESGTGKEVVARAIHATSPRNQMPMVVIHCGAITETLLESELFGHERGAFTGAQFRKKGKFELADGGTVFLDEIGDISLKTQTDLLRVLQEKEIVRVGGNLTVPVDFRCIAATNRSLEQLVESGSFRADLYYRLHVLCLELPPLRDRREDIPLLVEHFLTKLCASTNRPEPPRVRAETMDALVRYHWPGNVRELENSVERALVVNRGPELLPADFPFTTDASASASSASGRTLEDVERAHIERVFHENNGNCSRTARVLNIDRSTLYAKLRRYGLR